MDEVCHHVFKLRPQTLFDALDENGIHIDIYGVLFVHPFFWKLILKRSGTFTVGHYGTTSKGGKKSILMGPLRSFNCRCSFAGSLTVL